MEAAQFKITGHLDIFTSNDELQNEIYINGDPLGLRSLANALMQMANIIEEDDNDLLIGDREHILLRPNFDLSKSSNPLIIGRLEAKLTGNFPERYVQRENGI